MDINNFRSNSDIGDQFISGMANAELKWKKARELFTYFIESIGFDAWHIHDGWVMYNQECGDILNNKEIELTWISAHGGYSHSHRSPEFISKLIIVVNSPSADDENPFNLYCYDATILDGRLSPKIKLSRIEIKQAVFNAKENSYQLYVKPPTVLSRLLNYITP